MKIRLSRLVLLVLAFSSAGACFAQEPPQSFPQRPVRVFVPYSPGGGTDVLARIAAQELHNGLGQPFIVENKPGADGILAAELVKRAAPDGYTLLVAPSGVLVMNAVLKKALPYSPQADFVPISVVGRLPLMITVKESLPVKSVKELVDYANSKTNDVTYASSSALFQLATELFKQKTGTNFLRIPYKSSADSVVALVSGQVTLAIADIPPISSLIQDNKLRALAYTDHRRNALFPDVPTVAEAGFPGTEIATLVGFVAPKGTPDLIVRKIQDVLIKAAQKPEVRARLINLGIEPVGSTSEEFATAIKFDTDRLEEVARRAGIEKQ